MLRLAREELFKSEIQSLKKLAEFLCKDTTVVIRECKENESWAQYRAYLVNQIQRLEKLMAVGNFHSIKNDKKF